MMRSQKSNQKLLDYLCFVVLLNLTQTVLRTECQKDLFDGHELLLSSAASSVLDEMNSGGIDVDKLTKLEHKYAFDILKMAENHLLNAENKKKMAKIVELFIQGIGKCYEILKAHKNGLIQRRKKRMAFDIERGTTTTRRDGGNESCAGHLAKAIISAALAPCFAIDGFVRNRSIGFTALFAYSAITFLYHMYKLAWCLCMCCV
uniref:Uncharacterized protein n=1 Tax=Globodera rostochiensis TaxID=31243 RepID=A0A914I2U6_GLORO